MSERMCGHPELVMGVWYERGELTSAPKPPPTAMVGPCEHNMACPTCGWGWGCAPDPCDSEMSERRPTLRLPAALATGGKRGKGTDLSNRDGHAAS